MSISTYFFTLYVDFQTLSLIFSFIVVLLIIKWGIDEGVKERKRDK